MAVGWQMPCSKSSRENMRQGLGFIERTALEHRAEGRKNRREKGTLRVYVRAREQVERP